VSVEQIQVLIHPQSIVHSMVGFEDGGVMAQLGEPDMMHAIAYAFSYPDRMDLNLNFPDFTAMDGLTFDAPDTKRFPSLEFAFEACRRGGTLPAVMNAANEIAVDAFLKEHIGFSHIFTLVDEVMGAHTCIDNPELSGIIEADRWGREKARSLIQSLV
jgi:1-deoxy-D-xylulose-5-phosphate reductoisomerase